MSIDKAREHLKKFGLDGKIQEFETSSATVALAAMALRTDEERIAKTLSFDLAGETVLIVAAGDAKINNSKFKTQFGKKAKMLSYDEVEERVGHGVGGVCPFGVNDGVRVYLDESMKRFDTVYPACGSSNSAIELTLEELEKTSKNFECWVDVCKGWREEE